MKRKREGRRLVAKAADEGPSDRREASAAFVSPMSVDPYAVCPRVEEPAAEWSEFIISSGSTGALDARLCADKIYDGALDSLAAVAQ